MSRRLWSSQRPDRMLERIRRCVIGDDVTLDGPFGRRRLVYADYTASGRALTFIEDFIRDHVLPMYANTHTEATATGRRTPSFASRRATSSSDRSTAAPMTWWFFVVPEQPAPLIGWSGYSG